MSFAKLIKDQYDLDIRKPPKNPVFNLDIDESYTFRGSSNEIEAFRASALALARRLRWKIATRKSGHTLRITRLRNPNRY